MKIASYNVENMFRRPKAFDPRSKEKGDQVVKAYSEVQELIGTMVYTDSDKQRILALLDVLGLKKSDSNEWALLRQNRGHLISRHKDGTVEVNANGRPDWVGWFELVSQAVNEVATHNTAAVIRDVDADVLAVIEVEDRPALERHLRES